MHAARMDADPTDAMMVELGFKVGDAITHAKREKDAVEQVFAIEAMKDGVIKLVDVKMKKPAPSAELISFQSKQWKIVSQKQGTWHVYKEAYAHHGSTSVLQNIVKSAAALAVHAAWEHESLESDELKVLDGSKGVMACKSFGVNSMTLSPNSQNFQIKEVKPSDHVVVWQSWLVSGINSYKRQEILGPRIVSSHEHKARVEQERS